MTREEAKELLPIIQAFAEGEKIEYYDYRNDDWIETSTPVWPVGVKYRIKPESKYRPFKTQEECWNEMLKHQPFGWLKSKKTGSVGLIGTLYTKDEVLMIRWATNECNKYTSFDVFNDYVFTDGEPFGINEE